MWKTGHCGGEACRPLQTITLRGRNDSIAKSWANEWRRPIDHRPIDPPARPSAQAVIDRGAATRASPWTPPICPGRSVRTVRAAGSSPRPDSCHYLVPISIEIVEEFLGGFGDFGVEGEVLAVDLD